jgi:hypothetical protein
MKRMRDPSDSVIQLRQRRMLRNALRVALVLICLAVLAPILALIVEPLVWTGAQSDQSAVAIAGRAGSPITIVLDVTVEPARPVSAVYLNSLHAAGTDRLDVCHATLALATGRQVILPGTPAVGEPPTEPPLLAFSDAVTLTGGVPISGTTGFLAPPGMDMVDTWWTHSALPGFVAECEAHRAPDTPPEFILTGGQAVGDQELTPVAARTIAQALRTSYSYPFDRYQLLLSTALFEEGYPVVNRVAWDDAPGDMPGEISVYQPVSETALVPHLEIAVSAPGWEVSERPTGIGGGNLQTQAIVLERPLATRTLAVIFLLVILAITCAIPFIQETSSVVEILLTIFVSLWGVRAVLIPDYITFPTAVDHAIVVLYILLTFALFLRFAVLPAWRWLADRPGRDRE